MGLFRFLLWSWCLQKIDCSSKVSKEPPPDKEDHDEAERAKGTVLVELASRKRTHEPAHLTCLRSRSQLILTAAFLYFLLSSFKRPLISPILSRLSPLYNRSSIFFVITLVTSFSSSFSLSRFALARESWYVFFVRWMKVSNSTKAYGRKLCEWYCDAG